jgi:hypothetical protein
MKVPRLSLAARITFTAMFAASLANLLTLLISCIAMAVDAGLQHFVLAASILVLLSLVVRMIRKMRDEEFDDDDMDFETVGQEDYKPICDIESDWLETGIPCPTCGYEWMTFSNGQCRPQCSNPACLSRLSDDSIWSWLITPLKFRPTIGDKNAP